ncbi:hypothetical protein DCC62_12625 [candidate division KSB1 bacterium]|nr:MAG: hypothetical protein DCC62_12625 [candidate division KSB1 bacterium]
MPLNKIFQRAQIHLSCFLVFLHLILASTSVDAQTANKAPIFVYVKTAAARVAIKQAKQADWNEVQKFGRLFPGDSLKIPEKTTVLLGDGSSPWQEFTGPKAMIVPEAPGKESSEFVQFFERLYLTFFVEPHRRTSKEGVRNTETLFLAMPDTVFAYALPDTLRWIKNAPWWTAYRVQITHGQETISDTVVRGNAFRLNASTKRRQRPGNYQLKVTLPQSPLLGSEADSSVIHVLQKSEAAPAKSRLEKLKKRLEQKGRIEDYFALANFCLTERLNLELEHDLMVMARAFPDNPEPKIMLYSYYAAFLPEQVAEQLTLDSFK